MSDNAQTLKVNIYPTGNAFTRNPIFLAVSSPSMTTYRIRVDNKDVFQGNGIGEFRINIAEIVETGIMTTQVVSGHSDKLLEPVRLSAKVAVHVANESKEEADLSFTAWKGGVSKKEFKRFLGMGTDIFKLKFLNEACNFFFTTRSNDWRIIMRETELYPLCFIYPEHELKIKELLTGKSFPLPVTAAGTYALNPEAVRFKFFTDYGVLANLFDIYSGETFACRIGIEQSPTVRERYRLRFLNSYGAYELFSLDGEASVTPGMNEDENTLFQRYDEITDSYYSDRTRIEIQESVTIRTGFKHPQEIRFLLDLLSSDDVYLLGYGREEIKVIPSAEEFSFRVCPETPQNVTLKLTFAEKDSNWSQEAAEGVYKKPRIHTKEFSNQFN